MKRAALLITTALVTFATLDASAEMTPARWANSKNIRMFFDDDILKAATDELDAAYRYEVEAVARVLADCDGLALLPAPPDECARSISYFLVVSSKADGTLPRLILAMASSAREMRLQELAQPDGDQKRGLARWSKVQGALVTTTRSRLLTLAKDGR
jgi:hypothetical protein